MSGFLGVQRSSKIVVKIFVEPVCRCLYMRVTLLKLQYFATGNQCNCLRTGVILENLKLFMILAMLCWTHCDFLHFIWTDF